MYFGAPLRVAVLVNFFCLKHISNADIIDMKKQSELFDIIFITFKELI